MVSRCQNSAVVPGLMGGLLMQIARGCSGGGGNGNCAEIWECVCLERGEKMPKEKMERVQGRLKEYFDGQD